MTDEQIKALQAENDTLKAAQTKLTADNKKLVADNASLKIQNDQLTAANKQLESDKSLLQSAKDLLTTANEQLTSELAEAGEILAEFKTHLAAQTPKEDKLPALEIAGKLHELTSPFMWAGVEITIDKLKEDAALAAELVEAGVSNLRAVL